MAVLFLVVFYSGVSSGVFSGVFSGVASGVASRCCNSWCCNSVATLVLDACCGSNTVVLDRVSNCDSRV